MKMLLISSDKFFYSLKYIFKNKLLMYSQTQTPYLQLFVIERY